MVQRAESGRTGVPGLRAFGAIIQAVRAGFRRRASAAWERHKLAREFAGLRRSQLEGVLRDFGISRDEFKVFLARAPYSRDLLDRMLARLGIGRDDLRRDLSFMRDIERQCAMCDAQGRCHRWLADGRDAQGYRRFCPNAGAFESLIASAKARGASR